MAGMVDKDVVFMQQALVCAHQALDCGEIPIGAVVVTEHGDIIGSGFNKTEQEHFQGAHAEMRALQAASRFRGDWRLDGCTIYVTLEPCLMCFGAIALSRVERIVYGSVSPLFGYHLDNGAQSGLYTRQIKNITKDVLADESAALLKLFFSQKREKKRE